MARLMVARRRRPRAALVFAASAAACACGQPSTVGQDTARRRAQANSVDEACPCAEGYRLATSTDTAYLNGRPLLGVCWVQPCGTPWGRSVCCRSPSFADDGSNTVTAVCHAVGGVEHSGVSAYDHVRAIEFGHNMTCSYAGDGPTPAQAPCAADGTGCGVNGACNSAVRARATVFCAPVSHADLRGTAGGLRR